MKINIFEPYCFTEIGERGNNEDCIYPLVGYGTSNDKLFLVCDGVGGHIGGEIASEVACKAISDFFNTHRNQEIDEFFIKEAIANAKRSIKNVQEEKSIQGIATTLALLCFTIKGVIIAHLGDSRIFQLRNNKIILQTQDHTLVNNLVKAGMITREAAKTHPNRNQLTRSLNGEKLEDIPEIQIITDVKVGDYFFLCSDGVLEQVDSDEVLEYCIFQNDSLTNKDRLEVIRCKCYGKTKDNFSAYLVQVSSVEEDSNPHSLFFKDDHNKFATENTIHEPSKSKFKFYNIFITVLSIVCFILCIIIIQLFIERREVLNTKNETKDNKVPNTQKKLEDHHIFFGKNVYLEVIQGNVAKRIIQGKGIVDQGTFEQNEGYVWFKGNSEKNILLLVKNRGDGKIILTTLPLKLNNYELQIQRLNGNTIEKINLITGEIVPLYSKRETKLSGQHRTSNSSVDNEKSGATIQHLEKIEEKPKTGLNSPTLTPSKY